MIHAPTNSWWQHASTDTIREKQGMLLHRFLKYRVLPFSKYYSQLFQENKLSADDFHSIEDLAKLPFTSKSTLENPKDFVLIPDKSSLMRQPASWWKLLRHGPSKLTQYFEQEFRPIHLTSTTGRSAQPVPFLYTKQDLANLEAGGLRLMQLSNTNSDAKIINAFPFAPHLAFWQAWYASLGNNCFVLHTGGGKVMGTHGNAQMLSKINANGIIAMPTFMYHLLQHAIEEKMQWPQLNKIVLGGEKVPLGMRRKLRELCAKVGARHVDIVSTYGFTEAKLAFSECVTPEGHEPSGYHLYPDLAIVEVVDPESGTPVPDREPGEIVFTPLNSRGTTVLRYRTGDLIEGGISHAPCPHCGRTSPRLIGKISRVSDIKRLNINKVKGSLIDLNALEHLLEDTQGVGAWQIELRKENDDPLALDEVHIHLVSNTDDHAALSAEVTRTFRDQTEITPNTIQFHSWQEMLHLHGVGKELKEIKIVDNRPS
ncbi:phenylacetate--CoA ligase family protein [Rubritalea marina]|uniref:phenylacetate--CoA ligase family protein n=1 Tax=Rubritalea marina TaxID=361055 RepID=UPI0012EA3A0A|nr:AMP-binding protein [Rubritalea marina]